MTPQSAFTLCMLALVATALVWTIAVCLRKAYENFATAIRLRQLRKDFARLESLGLIRKTATGYIVTEDGLAVQEALDSDWAERRARYNNEVGG